MAYSVAGLGKIAKRLFDLRNAPASGFEPGDFDFQDFNVTAGNGNTVTFTKAGTIFVLVEEIGNNGEISNGYIGGTVSAESYFNYNPTTGELVIPSGGSSLFYSTYYALVEVENGDTMTFYASAGGDPFNGDKLVSLYDTNEPGKTLLDTFTVYKGGCYLTTAVVQYKGLSDSDPELTAMRKLREHYRQVEGYDLLIQEYYENAPKIIEAIGEDPETYEEIYRSVKMCQAFVENENWQAAHDEYFRMYNDLKARYLK
jgi:hypothetical protein